MIGQIRLSLIQRRLLGLWSKLSRRAVSVLGLVLLPSVALCALIQFPYTDEQVRQRVEDGLATGIAAAQVRHDPRYALWQKEPPRATYKIVSSQPFYYGIFNAYFWALANATDRGFRLVGNADDRPDILVVMDYKIDSWESVNAFLKDRRELGFEKKLDVVRSARFTGCTADLFQQAGRATEGLIVVNIARPAFEVRKCLYRTAFQIFGYNPVADPAKDPSGMSLDLAVVAALYKLHDDQLAPANVVGSLLNQLSGR